MERKIGEIFEYNGEWYQCVEDTECISCINCCFYNGSHKLCTDKNMGACAKEYRSDAKSICFKELEKVGEPYIEHDHSMNKDVVVQDYKLYNQHACYNGHEKILCFGLFGKDGLVTIKSKEPIKSLNCKNSVEIEVKQNKEDMEEKNLNLKPFDIQKAREGKPVCTRDGHKARIICFDYNGETGDYPIVALVHYNKGNKCYERVLKYTSDGLFNKYRDCQHDDDLMMIPEKKEEWVNVYKRENEYICENECNVSTGIAVYKSEGEAKRNIDKNEIYVNTIKITWEE